MKIDKFEEAINRVKIFKVEIEYFPGEFHYFPISKCEAKHFLEILKSKKHKSAPIHHNINGTELIICDSNKS